MLSTTINGVMLDLMERTLSLDPSERNNIEECQEHRTFHTERLLRKELPRPKSAIQHRTFDDVSFPLKEKREKMKEPNQQSEHQQPEKVAEPGESEMEKMEALTSSLSLESSVSLESRAGEEDEERNDVEKVERAEQDKGSRKATKTADHDLVDEAVKENPFIGGKYSKYSKAGKRKQKFDGNLTPKDSDTGGRLDAKAPLYVRTTGKPRDRGRIYPVKYPEVGQKREKALSIMAKYSKYMKHVTNIPGDRKLKRKGNDGNDEWTGGDVEPSSNGRQNADNESIMADKEDSQIGSGTERLQKETVGGVDGNYVDVMERTSHHTERRSRTALGSVGERDQTLSNLDLVGTGKLQLHLAHGETTFHGNNMLGKRSSEGQRSQSRMSEGQKVKKSSKVIEENNNKEMLPTQGSENTDANSRADKGDVNRDGDTVVDMNLPDAEHLFKQDYKRSWKDENKQKKKKKTSQDDLSRLNVQKSIYNTKDRDNNQSLHRQIKKMRRLATTPTSEIHIIIHPESITAATSPESSLSATGVRSKLSDVRERGRSLGQNAAQPNLFDKRRRP
ncbi:putative cyclin-dependent kinase-like 5 isoform X1 [Apostichopus japonicus]|uniref:Putative cyclin-dependent kinase-like 5 isoform X1 n=1 Tax=Stichopus japonicus TaxID=307972 RepID=A0A2G8LLV0_STIJA|nr:putative cyclin-dependent kinase-like 5 isoform X1 [Apostichopus japonicus]